MTVIHGTPGTPGTPATPAAPGTDPLAEAIYQRDRWIESYNQEHLRRVELEGEVEWLRARVEALEQGEGNHER